MIEAVQREYDRRGRPLEYTGWSIGEVRTFMQARMKKLEVGDDVGVFAHMLPKRPSQHEPAPLPAWTQDEWG